MGKGLIDDNDVSTAVHGYLPFITTAWSRTISQACCWDHISHAQLVSRARRPSVHSAASKGTPRMDKLSIPSSPWWYLFQDWWDQHLPVSLTSVFLTQVLVTFFLTDWLPCFKMLCVFYWLILENFLLLSQVVVGRKKLQFPGRGCRMKPAVFPLRTAEMLWEAHTAFMLFSLDLQGSS